MRKVSAHNSAFSNEIVRCSGHKNATSIASERYIFYTCGNGGSPQRQR